MTHTIHYFQSCLPNGKCVDSNCRYPQKNIQLDPSTRLGASCAQKNNHAACVTVPLFINTLVVPIEL